MKKVQIFFLLAVIICISHTTLHAQRIFLTDSVKNADIKVFVTSDSTNADLKVCLVDSVKKVYKDGTWFMVNQVQFSNLSVKIVTNPLESDLKIYYVSLPKKAGWVDTNKRFYYRRKK
ncbi:MAG: DUF6150 family protein [Bacteroidetes bacterium]|nr:DUF6150 family protein [Bacteroidota bacterium]